MHRGHIRDSRTSKFKERFLNSVSPKLRLLSAAIALAALTSAGCSKLDSEATEGKDVSSYVSRAEDYRHQGQYRAALIEARNAIDAAPGDDSGKIEIAKLFLDMGQSRQALKAIDSVSAPRQKEREVILARTDALLLQGKYHSAQTALQPLTGTDEDPEIRYRQAQVKAGLGQADEARSLLQALAGTPRATDARLQLARIEIDAGNDAAAAQLLQEILKQQPDHIEALTLSARQAERSGNLAQAETLLSHALMKVPDTDVLLPQKVIVLQNLMTILTRLGRSTESLIYAKVLAEANPEGVVLQNKLKQGLEAFRDGKLDTAEQLVTEAYQQSPIDYAGILLGMIKYAKKDYAGASQYLAAHIDPETAPSEALSAFAASEIRLRQPQRLLEVIGPEQREMIGDPEMKALVGVALVQSGDTAAGEEMLLDALRADPDNVPVRTTLARHYLLSGKPDRAIKLLKESIAKNADAGLQRMLVSSYIAAGDIKSALDEAKAIAASKPEQASNLHVLGRTALIAKQYDVSETSLKRALQLQADYKPAQADLAQLMLIRKQPQQAQAIYRDMIAAAPDNVSALKGFITTLQMQGNDSRNIETTVLQLTKSGTARAVLAEYFLRGNQPDHAQRLLDAVTDTSADSYAARVRQMLAMSQGITLLQQGDTDKAREFTFNGLRVNPNNTDLLALLGQIEIRAKAFKEAEKVIEQIAQIQPDAPSLKDLRGKLAAANGDRTAATKEFQRLWNDVKNDSTALKLYQSLASEDPDKASAFLQQWQQALPDSDVPWFLQGMQQQTAGNNAKAVELYEAAIKRNQNNALALNNLAVLYSESGDSRALSYAERAYQLQPKNPAILDTYGWMLFNGGDKTKGRELLQQALLLAPDDENIRAHAHAAEG
jgi:tetratricopeptide (TPR) repeat protein